MFFDSWSDTGRVILSGFFAYVALVAMLRASGKRTLSKMNAFDLVVTVALGSTLATVLLSKDTALVEAVAAFATLIGLQFVVAWTSVRSPSFGAAVSSEPRLLYYGGHFLRDAMRRERVTESEVAAAVRQHGCGALDQAYAVVLESSGELAVISNLGLGGLIPPGDPDARGPASRD